MTPKRFVLVVSVCGAVLLLCVALSLSDVQKAISGKYRSAHLSIHEGHSPSIHPLLDVLRLVRGKSYIPESSWVSVSVVAEREPVDCGVFAQFKVAVLKIERCTVVNLSALMERRPTIVVELAGCDLGRLTDAERARLRRSSETAEVFYFGAP